VSESIWAQLHEKVWVRPMTTLAEEFGSPVVVSQKSASAFDVPVPPRGYWAKLQNHALPILVAALRSLPCSFAGTAAGRIWNLRSSPVFDREEESPDRRETCRISSGLRTDRSLRFVTTGQLLSSLLGLRVQGEHPSLPDVFRWLTDR
jgi:hypothetical protein